MSDFAGDGLSISRRQLVVGGCAVVGGLSAAGFAAERPTSQAALSPYDPSWPRPQSILRCRVVTSSAARHLGLLRTHTAD
jgi:hypothetical protein